MKQFLEIFAFAIKIFPQIVAAVKVLEENFNIPKVGAEKAQVITDILKASAEVSASKDVDPEIAQRLVQKMLEIVVGFAKRVGLFKSSGS